MDYFMYSNMVINTMGDKLTLYFAFIIILITIPIVIYSVGYVQQFKNKYSIPYFWSLMILFVLSMLGVVFSNNSISFLVFWELMSVFSFFLVIYEFKHKDNLNNGIMYFIMTHISGLFLMLMFGFIAKYSGSTDFTRIMAYSKLFTSTQKTVILVFAMLGFGAKAGLLPLHAWLPKAHPSAPSNISALMSGVMLKIALYGFIRVAFMFLSTPSIYIGVTVMLIGTVTAIFAGFNALFQQDIKKLLAYSSAENIGIIFSTLGVSLIFHSYGLNKLGAIALTAALFHILNHGVFKSLLFTTAGSVLYGTGSKNMLELGGLHNKMKITAFCALIGTAAISAIPPLNGFASEILIFKSFMEAGIWVKNIQLALIIIGCGVILAITSGCVIWSSVKNFALVFLGNARSKKAEKVKNIPREMNFGMGILSIYSIILGVLAPIFINYIYKLSLSISSLDEKFTISNFGYEITLVSALIVVIILCLKALTAVAFKEEKVVKEETWGCGFNNMKSHMQYSACGFTQSAARFAGNVAGYRKEVKIGENIFLKTKFIDLIEKYLYFYVVKFVDILAGKIVKIHYGRIQIYICYIFISLIVAIFLVMKFV